MTKAQLVGVLLYSVFLLSCGETNPRIETSATPEPSIDLEELALDFKAWWTYHNQYISLSANFTGLNTQSDTISKRKFLKELLTGNYIPVRMKDHSKLETLKLFRLDSSAHKSIRETIQNVSATKLKQFEMEGTPFPEFNFTDLNGNSYTNSSTAGKKIILKTWFINCQACIAEFPELNEFVEENRQRKDIIYLSLATNPAPDLEAFLQTKAFNYPVISNQSTFIQEKLNLQAYPTHIVVNEEGTILKVVNKASEMISFFESNL